MAAGDLGMMGHTLTSDTMRRLDPFYIYYADQVPLEDFDPYPLIVLEPDFYTDVDVRSDMTLAYLSVGEVHPTRPYFDRLQDQGILLGRHPYYESHYLSLKDDLWLDHLISFIIPQIVSKGFSGLMLDTVDSLLSTHTQSEVITLINTIKKEFPRSYLMQNRGFEIMAETKVDAFLLESTLSDLDATGAFVRSDGPGITPDPCRPCYSVDYWDPEDVSGRERLYQRAFALGYTPLVTSRDLTQPPEPSTRSMQIPTLSLEAQKDMVRDVTFALDT